MPDKPVILSQTMVDRALVDNAFYGQLPEFNQLRSSGTMPVIDTSGRHGCSGCKRTKLKVNQFRDFVTVATALTQEGTRRLKTYFGVGRIMINVTDSKTRQVMLKIL